MKLAPNLGSDRAWVWNVSADYAEAEPTAETFAIRFANSESESPEALGDESRTRIGRNGMLKEIGLVRVLVLVQTPRRSRKLSKRLKRTTRRPPSPSLPRPRLPLRRRRRTRRRRLLPLLRLTR
jgi:Ran-binding protein 1